MAVTDLKEATWKAACVALCLNALMLFATLASFPAHAQKLSDRWVPLSFEEFRTNHSIFSSYGVETHRDDLVVLDFMSIKIFRIESADFCNGSFCLTIVAMVCGRVACPSTAVFVKREVEFDKHIMGPFGGTWLLVFPLSHERSINVIVNKTFVSAWRGFGDN